MSRDARRSLRVQKRRWGANLGLLAAPFLVCVLLFVLQNVINKQLDSRDFRCGCKCLSCCDWVPGEEAGRGAATGARLHGLHQDARWVF